MTELSLTLEQMFGAEPDRLAAFSGTVAGVHIDLSRALMTTSALRAALTGPGTARAVQLRDAMVAGEAVNASENRSATHMWERGTGPADAVADVAQRHALMDACCARIDAGVYGPARFVLHLGIGGSALGPHLAVDALATGSLRTVAVVSNVDGEALARVQRRFDPHATLVLVASKTFTTQETITNWRSTLAWMRGAGVVDPLQRCLALTADPAAALAQGLTNDQMLPFAASVGGRYSLWSSIGLPLALAAGLPALQALRAGAAAMDRHFLDAPPEGNLPLMAAAIDVHNATVLRAASRAVFAYDERLALLPSYLQQLEMESNGKRVGMDGSPVAGPTAPVVWGGVGTDAQHAVFQLLHQGTSVCPVEFIAACEPGHGLDASHHRQLLANCLAQGAALMRGRSLAEAGGRPERIMPGNRPSATILLDRLDAGTLGALLAFYEHRTVAFAAMRGINPFDQWGVELGKSIAGALLDGRMNTLDRSTAALVRRAGLAQQSGNIR